MKKPTAISLFAGCGGSSLGYKLAGYEEKLAVEWWNVAVESFRRNFPDVNVVSTDISKLTGNDIFKLTKLSKGKLDVLDGSPPCQGFSISGNRELTDERNNMVKHYIRIVNEVRPRVFVMENVKGMIIGKMKGLFNEFLSDFRSIGYTVTAKLLNSQFYDVPQSRERIFIIGFRDQKDAEKFIWPEPNKRVITVRKAFNGVNNFNQEIRSPKASFERIKYITPGKSMFSLTCSSFNLYKANYNKPSMCIIKTVNILHPEENRFLTISELKRICSFPDDYFFAGSFGNQWGQMGNSVPPNMVKAIALQIKKVLQ